MQENEIHENMNDMSSEKSETVKFLDITENKPVVEEDIYAVFINNQN